jgi:hypothetical protein
MIRIKMIYVYLLSVGMAYTCVSYAMDLNKKENSIDRKKIGEMIENTLSRMAAMSEIGSVSNEAIAILQQDASAIAQAAHMPDRAKIMAESMRMAKYHRDYMQQEPDFQKRHLVYQRKLWEHTSPWYVACVPYDCTVIVKKKDTAGEKDIGESHTMHANKYSIHDAQNVIMIAIREYTRDYSKREDGKLNPDQLIECTLQFGAPVSCEHTFDICAGDAWQLLEKAMADHFDAHLERLEKKKK